MLQQVQVDELVNKLVQIEGSNLHLKVGAASDTGAQFSTVHGVL